MPRTRKPFQERRIALSVTGRMRWQPGDKHPLDVLFEDAQQMHAAVQEQLTALLASIKQAEERLAALLASEHLTDPTMALSLMDQQAQRAIWERFKTRKHHDHLQAVFGLLRRRRQTGRLQAAQAALDVAVALLAQEDAFNQDLLRALIDAEAKMHLAEQIAEAPAASHEETFPEREELVDDSSSLHVAPTLEDAVSDQFAPNVEVGEADALSHPLTDDIHSDASPIPPDPSAHAQQYDTITPLVGSVEQSRDLLRQFEERIRELREQLPRSNGWVEVFYVPKWKLKLTVVELLDALDKERQGVPVPRAIEEAVHPRVVALFRAGRIHAREDVPPELMEEVFTIVRYGPYANYRWREGKSPTYTVSLGPLKHTPSDEAFEPRY